MCASSAYARATIHNKAATKSESEWNKNPFVPRTLVENLAFYLPQIGLGCYPFE